MMELVDMPGRSILVSISRLWISNPKQVAGDCRGPFCDPTEGVLKCWVDGHVYMWGGPLKKKLPYAALPGLLWDLLVIVRKEVREETGPRAHTLHQKYTSPARTGVTSELLSALAGNVA